MFYNKYHALIIPLWKSHKLKLILNNILGIPSLPNLPMSSNSLKYSRNFQKFGVHKYVCVWYYYSYYEFCHDLAYNAFKCCIKQFRTFRTGCGIMRRSGNVINTVICSHYNRFSLSIVCGTTCFFIRYFYSFSFFPAMRRCDKF